MNIERIQQRIDDENTNHLLRVMLYSLLGKSDKVKQYLDSVSYSKEESLSLSELTDGLYLFWVECRKKLYGNEQGLDGDGRDGNPHILEDFEQ